MSPIPLTKVFQRHGQARASSNVHEKRNRDENSLPPAKLPADIMPGHYLQKHHLHTFIICFWVLCLLAYIISIERAIRAHALPPNVETSESYSFGRRGTKNRQRVVQIFSVARTVLTVAHVPLITATLSTTLPVLTQKTPGRTPPNLTAGQLFLLADRTWAGAGGWYEALRIGRLSWPWWKLTLIVLASFAGFPFVTLGYITASEQYWDTFDFYGISRLRFNDTVESIRNNVTENLNSWMHTLPQRELGMTNVTIEPVLKDAQGKSFLSFYPPADTSTFGHFVTYLEPKDQEPRLVVANARGMAQNFQCHLLQQGEQPKYINLTQNIWTCNGACDGNIDQRLCHSRTSVGIKDTGSDHRSQVVSCARPTSDITGLDNPAFSKIAAMVELEIALKIDPPYDSVSRQFYPLPENPWSFKAGDNISGTKYYVDILRCNASLIPGDGIIDSVIRRFMHFLPYGLGLGNETPEILAYLPAAIPNMLNITIEPALTLLHRYFLTSNYAIPGQTLNNSLPVWFGVHKPGTEEDKNEKVYNYVATAQQGFGPANVYKYEIDNMIRVDGISFRNSFVSLANSSLIAALPSFIAKSEQMGYSYQTDVKLERAIPIPIAPLVLLVPVLFVAWMSIQRWNVATWTEFLDAFAMFRLGRAFKGEMDGCGAMDLKHCYQAHNIPGFVGDSNPEKARELAEISGVEYVGNIKLGGAGDLHPSVKYG